MSEASKIGDIAAAAGIGRVHFLAWRDLADVEAGGSEVHAATIAKLWAAAGIDVTMRSSYAQGHPRHASRDGYRVIRRAGRYLVFPRAVGSELLRRHGPRDALVEIWNGMPFFSPAWDRGPKVVVLHHVHAEMWKLVLGDEAPRLARMGDLLERRVAPLAYRRTRIVTLSESSKTDIVEHLRLRPDRITVAPPGIDPMFNVGGRVRKSGAPLVVAVGRLVPVKRYHVLIAAVALARRRHPGLTLTIVGEGYERDVLDAVVDRHDGSGWVTFAGHLREDELVRLYRRAWLIASASSREGWGMALTEAAACGTPAVATRIAGHLDAVVDGTSGLLVEPTASALGEGIGRVVGDESLRRTLTAGALAHAGQFTWEATAATIMGALAEDALSRRR